MISRLAKVRSLLWSIAILLLVTGSDQLGWQAGHKAAKAEQVTQSEPMARAIYSVLRRVEQNQEAASAYASRQR